MKTKVLLIEQVIAPYRLSLCERFAVSEEFQFSFAYGSSIADGTVRSPAEAPPNWHIESVDNLYPLGDNRVCWQVGVILLIHRLCPDVVIGEFNIRVLSTLVAFLICRLRRIPFIWWGHGFSRNRGSRLVIWFRVELARLAAAVILYDDETREKFASLGIDQRKLFVARNSLDTEEIGRFRDKQQGMDRHRIIYVGRFTPRKKVALLIKAFSLLVPLADKKLTLTLIGDGPEAQGLRDLASELSMQSSVEFPGEIYDKNVLSMYWAQSLVCVAPGHVGLMAVHALANGVPTIVSLDEPHAPEVGALRDGETAIFFAPSSPQALASAIRLLVEAPDLRETMSRRCIEVAENEYGLGRMEGAFVAAIKYATGEGEH